MFMFRGLRWFSDGEIVVSVDFAGAVQFAKPYCSRFMLFSLSKNIDSTLSPVIGPLIIGAEKGTGNHEKSIY